MQNWHRPGFHCWVPCLTPRPLEVDWRNPLVTRHSYGFQCLPVFASAFCFVYFGLVGWWANLRSSCSSSTSTIGHCTIGLILKPQLIGSPSRVILLFPQSADSQPISFNGLIVFSLQTQAKPHNFENLFNFPPTIQWHRPPIVYFIWILPIAPFLSLSTL